MKKIFVILFCGLMLFALNSCDSARKGPQETSVSVIAPINYGNGVYYFNCNERSFATSLSAFIENTMNEETEIKAISGDGTIGHGYDRGYFVVVGKK
jgi:hypothetical protein